MSAPKKTRREFRSAAQFMQPEDYTSPQRQLSCDLLTAAREAVAKALPQTIKFNGQTYWLTVALGYAQIKIFDTSDKADPCAKQFFACMPGDPSQDGATQTYRITVLPIQQP